MSKTQWKGDVHMKQMKCFFLRMLMLIRQDSIFGLLDISCCFIVISRDVCLYVKKNIWLVITVSYTDINPVPCRPYIPHPLPLCINCHD